MLLLVAFLVLAVGSYLQRVSGMGVGLVAGPVLAVLLGPVEGILVVNVLAFINAALTTLSVRKNVDWRLFAVIAGALIIGIVPGAWLVTYTSPAWLQVLVGVLLLVALSVTTFGHRYVPQVRGTAPAAVAGAVGGFMNTLAGIAGPAITVYAQAARWEQKSYAATLQPIFMVAGALSFVAKVALGAGDLAGTDWRIWPVGVLAMLVGLGLGIATADKITKDTARRVALSLAVIGGITAIVRGAASLLGA